jgi:hypothetical protein
MNKLFAQSFVCAFGVFILFAQQIAYAQINGKNAIQKMETSDFVFEGEVLERIAEYSTDKSVILTRNIVRASKVYKGSRSDSMFSILTLGGLTEERFLIYGKALQLSTGDKGLFWLKKDVAPFERLGNKEEAEYWATEASDFLSISAKHIEEHTGNSTNLFDEVSEALGTPKFGFQKVAAKPPLAVSADCNDPNFESWAQISLENVQFSGNFTELECDVVLKAYPSGAKFGKGEFIIKLPKVLFGTYSVSNQNFSVQKSEISADANYTLNYSDLSDSTIIIRIDRQSVNGFSFELETIFKKLAHIKVRISNPLQIAALKSDAFDISGNVQYFCEGQYLPFLRTFFINPLNREFPVSELQIGIHYNLDRFYFDNNGLFTFDIFASSTLPSLYRGGVLFIDYDDVTFGKKIASGTTRVGGLLSTGYAVMISDHDDNTLRIDIIGGEQSKLVTLNSAAQMLMRCQIFLLDCKENLGFQWNALTVSPNHTYIENNVTFQYAPVTTSGQYLPAMCVCGETGNPSKPEITSLSKPKVTAGTGEILAIIGHRFGNSFVEGKCYIEVDNADHSPNRTRIPSADIISWTNTQIKFFVPSTTIGQTQAPMESGPVKVVNYCGESNTKDITVDYAVLNYRKSLVSLASEVGLGMNTAEEIKFEYTSGLDEDARIMIEEGLKAWRCNRTQIKWSTSIAVTNNYSDQIASDKRNIIKQVPPDQVPTAYAGVIRGGYVFPCGSKYYVNDIDIVVSNAVNWDAFDATQRNVFKHELGHAHLLEHAAYISSLDEKIMYYSYAPWTSIKAEDVAGGLHILAISPVILNGCTGVNAVKTMACTNATQEHNIEAFIVSSPNPLTDNFMPILAKTSRVNTNFRSLMGLETLLMKEN